MKTRSSVLPLLILAFAAIPGSHWNRGTTSISGEISDGQISRWVTRAIEDNPSLMASTITVTANDGVVQLSGQVNSLAARQLAEIAAEKVDGVRGVVDKIEVVPTRRRDEDITADVTRRLRASSATGTTGITTSTQNGVVTLSGDVHDRAQFQEVLFLASGVDGVRQVVSNLKLDQPSQMISDQQITRDALAALHRDTYLQLAPITITTRNGVVTITGTVGTLYQANRAANRVLWVAGARSVRNDLTIDPALAIDESQRYGHLTDDELQKEVTAELINDARIDASNIQVKVSHGDIKLDGSVPAYYQKLTAERDVRDVAGIARIDNSLEIRTTPREASAIRSDVELLIDTDAMLANSNITVQTKDGIVNLSGTAATPYQKAQAQELAARTAGVTRVVNNLELQSSDYTDAQIEQAIRGRLVWTWSTSMVARLIGVNVTDGDVTLGGAVVTPAQRLEAIKVALSVPGVVKVHDNITVDGRLGSAEAYYPGFLMYEPWLLPGTIIWP